MSLPREQDGSTAGQVEAPQLFWHRLTTKASCRHSPYQHTRLEKHHRSWCTTPKAVQGKTRCVEHKVVNERHGAEVERPEFDLWATSHKRLSH